MSDVDRQRCPSCKRWLSSAAETDAAASDENWVTVGSCKVIGWKAQAILLLILAAVIRGVIAFIVDLS